MVMTNFFPVPDGLLHTANAWGATQTFADVTVGSDGSGSDVIFYSDTSGDNLTWDASAEVLQITGTNGATALDVLDGDVRVVDKLYLYDRGGEYLSSDGSTLTITGAVTFSSTTNHQTFDVVVDVDGTGDATTLQAGDVLLAAGDSMWVKQGTYSSQTLVVDSNNHYIFVSPGTVIGGAITLSGTGITLVLGAQCDVQGLITLAGDNCSLICHGGVDTDGLLMSGDNCYHDGGGWDTLHQGGTTRQGLYLAGTDCIAENCSAETTAGGGQLTDTIQMAGTRCGIHHVKVIDSDRMGIMCTATDGWISDCMILGADSDGIYTGSPRIRITGNYIIAAGGKGISTVGGADDLLVVGNIIKDITGDVIDIDASAENCLVVANKLDGAPDDNSGTSTVASNEETAF